MIKRHTKADIRRELEQQTQAFLNKGGEVCEVESGETGLVNGSYRNAGFTFNPQRQERTPLNTVMATIDSRRSTKKPAPAVKPARNRKKVIYDDFGEPLRVVFE
ncbi:hypothetical protein [Amphritea sp. HPY]|uniref:hypothetical protein n=1 Tax=Amphritea sp. HPY TaxID=3421652 RepID=UPI003D7E5362